MNKQKLKFSISTTRFGRTSENLVSKKSFDFGFRLQKTWSQKRKNQNDKKETRPSKQCKSYLNSNLFCFVPIYKMEQSKDCYFNIDILFRRRKKRGKILGEGEYLFSGGGENREGKGGKYLEKISPKSVKDIEKSRFWSRSRDFCQFLQGFGIGFGEFGLGKKD